MAHGGDEADGGKEVRGQSVVTGSDPSEVLDPPEHALDGIAIAVEIGREAVFPAPVALWRDVWRRAFGLDLSPDGVAVITLVAMQDRCRGHLLQQNIRRGTVSHLAARQQEGDGAAEAVGKGVNLGRSSPSRTAYGLAQFPPFPPEAQRCALTAVLSINTCAGGPPAEARAWNISVQTPLAAQRTNRL